MTSSTESVRAPRSEPCGRSKPTSLFAQQRAWRERAAARSSARRRGMRARSPATLKPPTVFRLSATRASGGSDGWQHMNTIRSSSSSIAASAGPLAGRRRAPARRRSRARAPRTAALRRSTSSAPFRATRKSQPPGFCGTPEYGHCCSALSSASCTTSSASSRWAGPKMRVSQATSCPARLRNRWSTRWCDDMVQMMP